MVEAGAASALTTGFIARVVSPLGVVPKPHSDKVRLIVIMRYAKKITSSSESSNSKGYVI